MRLLRLFPWVLLIALVAFTAATYNTLPDRIPQRIDSAGVPTVTMPRSVLAWSLLPIVALVTLGGLQGLSAMLPKAPALFNFPDKQRLLRIPERYRGPVIEQMRAVLDLTSVSVLLVFGVVQWTLWRSALGVRGSGGMVVTLVAGVLVVPMILLLLPRLSAATAEAERRWYAEDPAAKDALRAGRAG